MLSDDGELLLEKILGSKNPADMLTKLVTIELHAEQKSVLKREINGGVKLAISINIPVASVRINEDEGCPDACKGMKSGGLIW